MRINQRTRDHFCVRSEPPADGYFRPGPHIWRQTYCSLAQPPLHVGPRDVACSWLSSLSSRWPNQLLVPCCVPNDKTGSAYAVRSFQRARSAGRLPKAPTPRSARCQECGSAGTRFRASSGSLPDRRSARSRRGDSGRLSPSTPWTRCVLQPPRSGPRPGRVRTF